MRNLTIERTVAGPRSSVWAVLADYPNIGTTWSERPKPSLLADDAQLRP